MLQKVQRLQQWVLLLGFGVQGKKRNRKPCLDFPIKEMTGFPHSLGFRSADFVFSRVKESLCDLSLEYSFVFDISFPLEITASESDMDHFYSLECLSFRCQDFLAILALEPLGDQQYQGWVARLGPIAGLDFDPMMLSPS